MDIELVTDGLAFPEGPIALDDGSVILTEIAAGRLTRVLPDGSKQRLAELGGGPNGAALGPDGAIYVCNNGGRFRWRTLDDGRLVPGLAPPEHLGGMIQRVDMATGRFDTVYDACEGERLMAPNDLVFDRTGGFWFTDHGRSDGKALIMGGFFYGRPDGSMVRKGRGQMISANGIGLSPDEATLYVADTQLGRLWSYALRAPGELGPPPLGLPAGVVATLPGYQPLDSLAVEAGGKVCVATIANGGITAIDRDGSTEHFPFPDPVTTNVCFGGADMRDAWVTCSSTGRLFKCRWPRPGLRLNFAA